MTPVVERTAIGPREWLSRLLLAGLTTALVDGVFASILSSVFYGSSTQRLWQGVAATVLGPDALQGGARTAAIGVLMHVGVAFGWSAIFLALFSVWRGLRRMVRSWPGTIAVASVYGPLVWLVMSLLVIPALTHRPPTIAFRWWVQFFAHMLFVALPIVASISRDRGRD
jgi:hypothetical protein